MPKTEEKKDYLGTALAQIDELMLSTLGYDRGSECAHLFALHLEHQVADGHLSKEVLMRFMANDLSPKDVGLSILDECVSALKAVAAQREADSGALAFISDFEKVIDQRMKTDPGRILPRNGHFAEAADAVGLDKWFKLM